LTLRKYGLGEPGTRWQRTYLELAALALERLKLDELGGALVTVNLPGRSASAARRSKNFAPWEAGESLN